MDKDGTVGAGLYTGLLSPGSARFIPVGRFQTEVAFLCGALFMVPDYPAGREGTGLDAFLTPDAF